MARQYLQDDCCNASSSMSSSSSCGSIEREADNQENLDELTLEEQAMTYGLIDHSAVNQKNQT